MSNVEVVQRLADAINRGDIEAVIEFRDRRIVPLKDYGDRGKALRAAGLAE